MRDAFTLANKESATKLEYKHLSQVVATTPRMSFLQDILPKKVKVKDYRLMMESIRQQNIRDNSSEDNHINSEDSEEDIDSH